VSAADVMHLAKLTSLRHLDLRDCQGRFRGQTMGFDDFGGDPEHGDPTDPDAEPVKRPEPPKQDGIGITDATVAALAQLKLEALLLGGSESLTDAIADSLAGMTTLRNLDLSNLPKISGALLARVPTGLTALALDANLHLDGAALRRLPPLPALREFGLSGLHAMSNDDLKALLQGKQLRTLRVGGLPPRGKGDDRTLTRTALTAGAAPVIATQRQLLDLDLSYARWIDASAMREIARLPELADLNLTATPAVTAEVLAPLAQTKRLRSLKLTFCWVEPAALQALAGAHFEELDLYGSKLDPAIVREAARAWPGCTIKLADGRRYVVPR
jgi:hypothetical protein